MAIEKITIIIPTRKRVEKLCRCLNSIPRLDYISIAVACDGDKETFYYLEENHPRIYAAYYSGHNGSVFCRNHLLKVIKGGGILYATDDIAFKEGSIQTAFDTFNSKFPEDDGVIGFYMEGVRGTGHPSGVGLVGEKFLDRYPDRQLFNPKYFHFSCQEILWLGTKLNKFYLENNAKLIHYHPSFSKFEVDEAHRDARKFTSEDHSLMKKRQTEGKIWGYNG